MLQVGNSLHAKSREELAVDSVLDRSLRVIGFCPGGLVFMTVGVQ